MLGGIGGRRRGDDQGWDGWIASRTRWTCAWVNSGSWWWTGRSGVLRFMGSQRVGHDWVTELNWTEPRLLRNQWSEEKYTISVSCNSPGWKHGYIGMQSYRTPFSCILFLYRLHFGEAWMPRWKRHKALGLKMCSLTPNFHSLMLLFFPSFILLKWFHTQVERKEALPPGRVYLHFFFLCICDYSVRKMCLLFPFIYLSWCWGRLKAKGEGSGRGWDGKIALLPQQSVQTLGQSERQRNLACCSPWDHKESDMT